MTMTVKSGQGNKKWNGSVMLFLFFGANFDTEKKRRKKKKKLMLKFIP